MPGPTRYHRAIAPAAYAHYVRGRIASYNRDFVTAIREFQLARRAAPDEPELRTALFEAILLHLSAP